MKISNLTTTSALVAVALAALIVPAGFAQESRGVGRESQDRFRVRYGNGDSLLVHVMSNGRSPMPFERDSRGVWVFRGDTAALVGKSYTVHLENHGRSRIKVVVGVDGVNVYFKKPIEGTAGRDVGSILGPGQNRVLTGFQVDERTAQRFVFSPPEFSEGSPTRGARIGEIDVQVYEESRADRGQVESRGAPSTAPNIGTTAGEDVDSEVRRVSFYAQTQEPIARLLLSYGRPASDSHDDDRELGRLGLSVESQREGLRIVRVERGGLADDFGLREGDVITKVDTHLQPTLAALSRILREKGRGSYLFLEVLRGRRHVVRFKLRL